MTAESFVLSIAASLIATILAILIATLFSARARGMVTLILGRLYDFDIDAVFQSSKDAHNDIAIAIRRAGCVRILVGRGNELQLPAFAPLFDDSADSRRRDVKVLLPADIQVPAVFDWTGQREAELAEFDRTFKAGLLRSQIEVNAQFLRGQEWAGLTVRRYRAPHFGRLILTERTAYLTLYSSAAHGRDSTVYKFRRGDFYDGLARLFDLVWEGSAPAGEVDGIQIEPMLAGNGSQRSAKRETRTSSSRASAKSEASTR